MLRGLCLIAAVLFIAKPAEASSITVLVGDKDWFGVGAAGQVPGTTLGPWLGAQVQGLHDLRSAGESAALNGAQLTDIYSALYYNYTAAGETCDPSTKIGSLENNPGCTPNGDKGSVILPFSGTLVSGSLTMLAGDFECQTWGAIKADVNGVYINGNPELCLEQGFRGTGVITITLDPDMIAAANLAGFVRLNLDHGSGYDINGNWFGSMDYFAFDYFELNAEVAPVPEPATLVLLGVGLVGLAARKRFRR